MSASDWAFAFAGSSMLLVSKADGLRVPTRGEVAGLIGEPAWGVAEAAAGVPRVDGRPCWALDLADDFEPEQGFQLVGLRAAHALVPEKLFRAAGTARQKIDWLRTHRFCSRCGTPATRHHQHEAMACPACGQLHFPRLAPAVIVLVQRGNEVLLGRSPHFTEGVYSTLAGFVEPGETLEEAVHREVEEEVGVKLTNVRYFGSQPHPFPHSLMVGFIADWVEGEIHIAEEEIEDARWFTPDDLPDLPHPMSIARALVEDFVQRASG
ncbi:MAG: NAD(+) diphosphatase [Longimicrobiales bacterium]|nr:NAD(+) diphosphatase [Longimicrobiales bacterium]